MKKLINEIKFFLGQRLYRGSKHLRKSKLYEKGFIVYENFLTEEECHLINKIGSEQLELSRKFDNDSRVFNLKHKDLENIYSKIDNISKIHLKGITWLNEIDRFYMFNEVKFKQGAKGSGGDWHRDSAFTPNFKTIVYTSDVTKDNGPFEYIENSHRPKSFYELKKLGIQLHHTRFKNDDVKHLESVKLTGKKGTLIIAITNGLHRGSPLKNGNRKAITRYNFYRKISKSLMENL